MGKKKKNILKNFIFMIFILLGAFLYSQYDIDINEYLNSNVIVENTNENNLKEEIIKINYSDSIKIASWNIQNFGQSKSSEDDVIIEISNRIQNYDIIALQEITNIHEKVDESCSRNEDSQNHENFGLIRNTLEGVLDEKYKIKISPQVYNERYLFVYDSSKVELVDSYFVDDSNIGQDCQVDKDTSGLMLREPYIGVFNVNDINITLMNVHTSPSNNHNELLALKSFYDTELEKHENLLLLGDLNYGCSYYPDFNIFNQSEFIFDDNTDTNVASSQCAYDRMIYDEPFIGDFINSGIDNTINRNMSDHYLIWTELAFE